jgi:CheY-like chemotaxis protein
MTILFIDDDPEDTELFCEVVNYLNSVEVFISKHERIECIAVNDGCQAVELMPTLSILPDLIFLDINMPIMGGKDCLKSLKRHPEFMRIPIVMFSTAFREAEANEFKELGAIDCVKKPNGFHDLVKILAKHVYTYFYERDKIKKK